MEVIFPASLITSLKDKHLILDTNLFRDATSKPNVFRGFLNELKKSDVTLATIDLVKYEMLKGSANIEKYKAKEKFINDIIDVTVPITSKTLVIIYRLIQEYGIDGTAVGITDLFLGAILMQYKKNIFLITRDTTDFIQNIFELCSIVNIPHNRGILTYGVYQYIK